MLLMDIGAEYANYSSDMTRTIPVNGKFSERQKAVYSAVSKSKKRSYQAIKTLVSYWADYHKEVGKIDDF